MEDRGPINLRGWPLGRLTEAGARFFSRNVDPRFVSAVGHEPPSGDIWYVEEDAWRGVWIRRPETNTFDASMTMAGIVVVFVATVERSGDDIMVRRDGRVWPHGLRW